MTKKENYFDDRNDLKLNLKKLIKNINKISSSTYKNNTARSF